MYRLGAAKPNRQTTADAGTDGCKQKAERQHRHHRLPQHALRAFPVAGTDAVGNLHRKTRSRGAQQSAEEPCGCRHQAYRRRGLSAEASNHRCVDILHHYRRQLRHNRRHTQHHRQAHLLSSRHSPTFADHRQQPVCLSLYSHNSKCKINQNFRTSFLASISPSFSSLIIIAVWLRPIF